MYIVWYGKDGHDVLVQTDNVAEVCAKAQSKGYVIKDVVLNNREA